MGITEGGKDGGRSSSRHVDALPVLAMKSLSE